MFWIIAGLSTVAAAGLGLYEYDKRQVKIGDTVIVSTDKVAPNLTTQIVITQDEANINNLIQQAKSVSGVIEVKNVSQKSSSDPNQWQGLVGPGLPVVFNRLDVLSVIRNGKVVR